MRAGLRKWLIAAVALAAVGAAGYALSDRIAGGPARQPAPAVSQALPVMRVRAGEIARSITASGNVRPAREVELRFGISGRVNEVWVKPGDRVEAGQQLAALDNRQQELAYLRARAAYEMALIDAAPNALREYEIDAELARDNLEQTILRAPFSGRVTEVYVEPGQSVGAADAVVHLIDDSVYEVQVAIDELDIADVAEGQEAKIVLDADPGRVRSGYVERIRWTAHVQGGVVTVPVTVRFSESDSLLRPGYTATVQITVAEAKDVPVVPVEAISEAGGVPMVRQMVDGAPVPTPVRTGLSDGAWVEIVEGVTIGDEIVAFNFLPGDSVGGPSSPRGGPIGFRAGVAIPFR